MAGVGHAAPAGGLGIGLGDGDGDGTVPGDGDGTVPGAGITPVGVGIGAGVGTTVGVVGKNGLVKSGHSSHRLTDAQHCPAERSRARRRHHARRTANSAAT